MNATITPIRVDFTLDLGDYQHDPKEIGDRLARDILRYAIDVEWELCETIVGEVARYDHYERKPVQTKVTVDVTDIGVIPLEGWEGGLVGHDPQGWWRYMLLHIAFRRAFTTESRVLAVYEVWSDA